MKVLLDTCVIIDALQDRQEFAENAQKILIAVANRAFEGFISAKSVTDIYYLTHKQTHSNSQTRMILQSLFSLVNIVDTLALDCMNAMSSPMSDYEDAVMSETSFRECMDYIVTRNLRDYTKSKVPVLKPADFLELLKSNITK
ncbi:MAG: PIN domain-containing protein [Spirochaetales bacterium]|nr:PIN domain-containing protein [Spirochaetales bacterium]